MRIWVVYWTDAHASTSGLTLKKAMQDEGTKTVTVGIPVSNTAHGLTLAMDTWPKHPKHFKVTTFIPWGMIDEWYEVEI